MATLIRSAKPGCSWTINELKAFNIQVQSLGLEQFFGITQLPAIPATIPSTILKEGDKPQGILDNGSRQFFKYLILVELRLGNDPPTSATSLRGFCGSCDLMMLMGKTASWHLI